MTAPLHGLRVALLEAQRTDEAAAHVRRFGGVPRCVPAAREARHPDRVDPFISRLAAGQVSMVVFLTGGGAALLFQEASRLGRLVETAEALRGTTVACRGPKPAAILRRYDVPVQVTAVEPYTTTQLLDALTRTDLNGKSIALVRDLEPSRVVSDALTDALVLRGARLEELPLYEWVMPDDLEPLQTLVRDLIAGQVDAIAFTNRVQSRHLFRIASELGLAVQLAHALNDDVLVAAVGPVCAEALQSAGVAPDIIPARATMAAMIAALAEYVELTDGLVDEN
ncbi:MAG: uroporphyrinogen-III synthase [Acidobacteriota bacterium]